MNQNISKQIIADKAEIELIADAHDESTNMSWLWAFLFGPIYYWVHGFVGRGFIIFFLNFVVIGIIISPFLARPAWRERALVKAEKLHAVNAASRRV